MSEEKLERGSAGLKIELKSGRITAYHSSTDEVLWHGVAKPHAWDKICDTIIKQTRNGCGAMGESPHYCPDEEPKPHREDWLDVEMCFKKNYISMFSQRQWIHEIAFLIPNDYKRYRCRCHIYRKHLDDLNTYCSAPVTVHKVDRHGGQDEDC